MPPLINPGIGGSEILPFEAGKKWWHENMLMAAKLIGAGLACIALGGAAVGVG